MDSTPTYDDRSSFQHSAQTSADSHRIAPVDNFMTTVLEHPKEVRSRVVVPKSSRSKRIKKQKQKNAVNVQQINTLKDDDA